MSEKFNDKQPTAENDSAAKKKHKTKILAAVLAIVCVVCSLGIFVAVWYLGDSYPDFERNFKSDFDIPGLDEGFVPQGLGNYNSEDTFFVSGYMNDGSPSRIYVVKDGEAQGYVTVNYEDGTVYNGHACGVATDGNKFWLVSESTLFVLKYSDIIEAAEENGTVDVQSSWDPYCNADFCYYYNSYLYVGEFFRAGNYETDSAHRLTTPSGDENTAIIFRFSASSNSYTPLRAYSVTGQIQGMAIVNDGATFVLSQSYGLGNSHILVYNANSAKSSSSVLKVNDSYITVYYLDSSVLINDYEIPCMSEGLCSVNDKVYVLFESASKKYRAFVRERIKNVYYFRCKS